TAARLGVSRGALEEAIRKAGSANKRSEALPGALPANRDAVLTELIWLLCEAPGIWKRVRAEFDLDWLDAGEEGELVRKILAIGSDPETLFPSLSEEERNFVTGVLLRPPPVDLAVEPEDRWETLRRRLEFLWKRRRIGLLEERVRAGGASPEAQNALRELVDLRKSLD
ncbi:hypothetical protein, partial [Methylacidimicrobium cyclopophantes]|uniref:hypothetical protein n=1 Tax=Methylacidimicrobium cyclopophantes TaxID=1041766 RepID=UPI0015B72203